MLGLRSCWSPLRKLPGKKKPAPAVNTRDSFPPDGVSTEKGPIAGPPTTWVRKIRSTAGAHLKPPTQNQASTLPKKTGPPLEDSGDGWQVVGKGGKQVQSAGPQSPHDLNPVGTDNSREVPLSYAESLKLNGGCASPGKLKADKARELLNKLKTKKIATQTVRGVTPPSTPPSPRIIKSPPVKSAPILTTPQKLNKPAPSINDPSTPSSPIPETIPPASPTPTPSLFSSPLPAPLTVPSPISPLPPTPPAVTPAKKIKIAVPTPKDPAPKDFPPQKKTKYKRGVHICRVDSNIAEKSKLQAQGLKNLRILQNFKEVNGKSVEDPRNFPYAPKILTVIKTGENLQVWDMLKEASTSFYMATPLAVRHLTDLKKSKQNCLGRVPMLLHPSLYRALKLTFPRDVGGVSQDGSISTEMGVDPMGPAVGVLTPHMFV